MMRVKMKFVFSHMKVIVTEKGKGAQNEHCSLKMTIVKQTADFLQIVSTNQRLIACSNDMFQCHSLKTNFLFSQNK